MDFVALWPQCELFYIAQQDPNQSSLI